MVLYLTDDPKDSLFKEKTILLNSIVLIKVSMKNFNAGRYVNQGHYQSF